MTARQLYDAILVELNKVEAPSLLLEDFNYFLLKAVYNYIHSRYRIFEVTQQPLDDLRVITKGETITTLTPFSNLLYLDGANTTLPDDYLHLLNCVVKYSSKVPMGSKNCANKQTISDAKGCARLTSDLLPAVIENVYSRPSIKNIYFRQVYKENPTINDNIADTPDEERVAKERVGNPSNVYLEVIFGKDSAKYKIDAAYVEYLRVPQNIVLTHEQLDSVEDNSQTLEFPDYVCLEIIKELCKLLFENASDPRLQTNIPINQVIAGGYGNQQ